MFNPSFYRVLLFVREGFKENFINGPFFKKRGFKNSSHKEIVNRKCPFSNPPTPLNGKFD